MANMQDLARIRDSRLKASAVPTNTGSRVMQSKIDNSGTQQMTGNDLDKWGQNQNDMATDQTDTGEFATHTGKPNNVTPSGNMTGGTNNGNGSGNGSGYSGLPGVSDYTASQLGNYQNGYNPNDAVTAAQQTLANLQSQRPEGYTSKYEESLNNILNKIQNPEKFKYTFDGDELFKSYADQYTQKGKQASLDAMGQAAALTGGYGNSYAQQVGGQQYQQYLTGLYDKGMDMYDRAYQRFQDEQNGLYNQYGVLSQQDQTEYGRYRDDVGDWERDRDYWTNQYNTESDRDYSRWANERDYWTGLAQVENADYRSEQERQEAIRQYEQNFAEQVRQFDETIEEQRRQFDEQYNYNKMSDQQKYAYNYAMAILQNGQMPSAEMLEQAGLSEEDAKKMLATVQQAGGGHGGSGYKPKTYYTDQQGRKYYIDAQGNATYVPDSLINNNDNIDTSYENFLNNLDNSNISGHIVNGLNGITNAVNGITGAASNTLSGLASWLGLKNKDRK